MASSVASVVSRLGEMAVAEAALLRGVDDYIPLLRDKLEWMQIFIQQESGGSGDNPYVDLWVRQTREVAYDVENVLDEFLTKVDLDKAGGWLGRWLRYVAGCVTHVSVRHDLKARMETIKNRLKDISDNANTYKVERLRSHVPDALAAPSSSTASYSTVPPFATWNEETEVVGFGSVSERQDLVHHILDSDTSRSFIAVVGENGAGKSTLVWQVHGSGLIRENFDVCAWINVPPEITDERTILYMILERIFPQTAEQLSPSVTWEPAYEALSDSLKEKRYLLVIDVSINFTACSFILYVLPKNHRGSRIIIITPLKSKEITFAKSIVHLSNLNQEDSLRLFCRNVFGDNNQFCDNVSESRSSSIESLMGEVHADIFEITEGLPLAVVVLAGLLRTKSIGDWDKVLKQLKSSNESSSKRVERILALSYGDLPIHLKSCFLYFAGFTNMILSARRLARLWGAEGFLVTDKKEETMEDIGQNNLRELISRRMINLVRKDLNGGVSAISIHDRIHAFAKSQAQEASFLVVHDNNVDTRVPASVRRLHLQNYMQSSVRTTSFPMLWSISCDFPEGTLSNHASNRHDLRYHAFSFLGRCRFLRVIDLQGLHIRVAPHAIGDMVHVRYLGLSSCFLTELPSSVARLTKLETLDIKRTEVEKVAHAFWEIPTLRHVVAKKLRLPKYAGLLNNMQTLIGLVCSNPYGRDIYPLHNMVYLRYLEISGLTMIHWSTLADIFRKLESLLFLRLAGDDIPFKIFTRFYLRQLQTLELIGRIDTSDIMTEDDYTLPNLTRLVLKLSMVDQMFFEKIGKLPSLVELVLSDDSYSGEKLLFPEHGFNNVTSLVMANLTELSEWAIRVKSIPKIKKIVVSGCTKMKIKLDMDHDLQEGWMEEVDEVLFCNMPIEDLITESADSVFSKKISRVTMTRNREDVANALQRDGRWSEPMIH